MGWDLVESFGGIIKKGRGMGVSRYTREEKNGERYIQNIQDISEKNTGYERNRYPGRIQVRGRYDSEKVTNDRVHEQNHLTWEWMS